MTPCIEWNGRRDDRGYGRLNRAALKARFGTELVHRIVWMSAFGFIPPTTVVMHLCDNTSCCRLSHLQAGTQGDNLRDMYAKGRARNGNEDKTHCPHGHPLSGDNVYLTRQGWRWCRECGRKRARIRNRRRYHELKVAS